MSKANKFAFDLGTRVIVPGTPAAVLTDGFDWPNDPVQGIVSGRKQMIRGENEYDVHVLNSDLSLAYIVCTEADLINAQPTPSRSTRIRKRR